MNAPVTLSRRQATDEERLAAILPRIPEIKALVAELFPGSIEVEIEEDPEIDGRRYLVFRVETRESVPVVSARRGTWYHMKGNLLGDDCDLACLDVIFLE